MFNGKSVLITGGTGSFGKGFVRRLLEQYKPHRLIVFSRDELKQFEMQHEFPESKYPYMRYFLGDVRDKERLLQALRGVQYVVHAAALKQVPAAEYNPLECVKTNISGAENVVLAAIERGVEKVVALSTDKACSPVNLYGATKLVSDKIFVSGNHLAGSMATRFTVVRYGNVIGSRGSVIPFFKKLLAENAKELPVTDEKMTRFWITIEQAVDFVLETFNIMRGGEIYVPKIPSMKISDLVEAMAPGIRYKVIGIRPGEKLHEEMISPDDAVNTYEMANRYAVLPAFHLWDVMGYKGFDASMKVSDRFRYASDTNTEWLDTAQIRKMVERC